MKLEDWSVGGHPYLEVDLDAPALPFLHKHGMDCQGFLGNGGLVDQAPEWMA